ncbi:MAG TPA: universal stress protein [Steroidobacter sp.]|jgi:nucleotide-binding universal stress UspA family protein|nr:universal stress protein [Steroidobacter sp.]
MYKKILVPVDGSPASKRGLEEAVRLAKSLNASLRLVHVVNELVMDTAYAPALYDERVIEALRAGGLKTLEEAEAWVVSQGLKAETQLVETIGGRAADLIVEEARQHQVDLIVMGTHGRRGVRRLVMGSDAELVLRSSLAPVLMVRASDA